MRVNREYRLAGTPEEVLDIMTTNDFVTEHAEKLGAVRHKALLDQEARTVEISLVVPTGDIAAMFRRFVGREVLIVDRRTWTPHGKGGYSSPLSVTAEAKGRHASITGQLRLEPTEDGTLYRASGLAKVGIPLIGEKAAAQVADLAEESLDDEVRLLKARLRQRR